MRLPCLRHYVADTRRKKWLAWHPRFSQQLVSRTSEDTVMEQNKVNQQQPEMASLLLGAGFALASLIILPAVAQRVGLGSSVTIALRGALMRAANRF